ncbi:MAG: chemotaxis protein CheW [Candidatus Nitrohelix vancouverensis]|uniref:Chemotaxis protein CheW n=1 Tax=Candidatus Nitrohelix vancouverensis TaxID=2705534 RepID=A0A7T0G245_9BACT|nr:MAG: chemotaxis protein CheW [Candidatus Nitrohelix vancouverensis]
MSDEKQFCTFFLDNHFFGVEVEKVQEVFRYQEMTPVPLASPTIRGLINLRGQIITAVDLRRRLNMPDRPEGQLPMNVVIRTSEGAVSLLVDEIGDVLEMNLESYEPPPDTISGITRDLVRGVYKLDTSLLLILDTIKTIQVDS